MKRHKSLKQRPNYSSNRIHFAKFFGLFLCLSSLLKFAASDDEFLCVENICQNGGVCLETRGDGGGGGDNNGPSTFYCKCPATFHGQLCENRLRSSSSSLLPATVGGTNSPPVCRKKCRNGGKCELLERDERETCACQDGYYGELCERIDCEEAPCPDTKICLFDVGERRFACEANLCALKNPCQRNVTCRPAKDDYFCECPPGLGGKNCDVFVDACRLCQNGASCASAENADGQVICVCAPGFSGTFCEEFVGFCGGESPCRGRGLCREMADGFECRCFPPYTGKNCELNADEKCSGRGEMIPLADGRTVCSCHENFTGANCEMPLVGANLEETSAMRENFPHPFTVVASTVRASTTAFSATTTRIRSSTATTTITRGATKVTTTTAYSERTQQQNIPTCASLNCAQFDGKICRNRTRLEERTTVEKTEFYCDCPAGRMDPSCAQPTTVTLHDESAVFVDRRKSSVAAEKFEYRIEFSFRTTLNTVVLASGETIFGATDYALGLSDGVLQLNVSGGTGATATRIAEIGIALNDADWHRIRFVNSLRDGCVLELEDELSGRVLIHRSLGEAKLFLRVFTTRFGQKGDGALFVGCLRDVKIDTESIQLGAQTRSVGVIAGCERTAQCDVSESEAKARDVEVEEKPSSSSAAAKKCANKGRCVDLWTNFRCDCRRPFVGVRCAHSLSEVTFGHSKRASVAEFSLSADDAALIRDVADVSLFLQTNAAPFVLFYLGENSTLDADDDNESGTFVSAEISQSGTIQVTVRLGGKQTFQNHTITRVNDNRQHFIRIHRIQNNITLWVDDVEEAQIIAAGRAFHSPLLAEILSVGAPLRRARASVFSTENFLRGSVQDMRVNERVVDFTDESGQSLTTADESTPSDELQTLATPPQRQIFARQHFAENLLKGRVSDDVCAELNPCRNGGNCFNTFNDYHCSCANGWIGKKCDERDYCSGSEGGFQSPCGAPSSTCRNTHGGYVCLSPATFAPTSFAKFSLILAPDVLTPPIQRNFTFELRSRSEAVANILALHSPLESLRVDLYHRDTLLLTYRNATFVKTTTIELNNTNNNSNKDNKTIGKTTKRINDGAWHTITIDEITTTTIVAEAERQASSLRLTIDRRTFDALTSLPFSLERFALNPKAQIRFGKDDNNSSFKGCLRGVQFGALPPLSFFEGADGMGGFDGLHPSSHFRLAASENLRPDGCHSDRVCFADELDECRNGAACVDLFNARQCACPVGFRGEFCEVNIDDCESASDELAETKCGVNGICVDQIANYTCVCAAGYTGERCETPAENLCETRYKNACLNGGKCESQPTLKCKCPTNFVGQYCQTARNEKCSNAPCKNNAKCSLTEDGGFSCACRAGFTGALCDVEVGSDDPCRQKPCKNGANCVPRPLPSPGHAPTFPKYAPDGFTCECRANFTGARCERFADVCSTATIVARRASEKNRATRNRRKNQKIEDASCQNGAFCENVYGGRICHCASGWHGADCSVDVDECLETAPCMNGAKCRNTNGGYECDCAQFYFGDRCEIEGLCARQVCRNGAVCEQTSAQEHVCHCAPGYRGIFCEEEIDFCVQAPCQNGASCRRVVAGFECLCAPGFTGKTCETDVDECALTSDACANNGTCVDRVNAFECDCSGTGYRGPQCLDDVDECAESDDEMTPDDEEDEEKRFGKNSKFLSSRSALPKCMHGACTNLPGSYRCDCEPGYIGERCNMANPCLPEPETRRILHACSHGKCVRPIVVRQASGREITQHDCDCDAGYAGAQCTFLEQAKMPLAIGFILGPFAVLLVVLCAFGTMLFFVVVRKKRATQGTYSPSVQEMTSAVRPPLAAIPGYSPPNMKPVTAATTAAKKTSRKSAASTSISAHLSNNGF